MPQSATLPTSGRLRKRWNPSGRCDSPIVAESYPLTAESHTPGFALAGASWWSWISSAMARAAAPVRLPARAAAPVAASVTGMDVLVAGGHGQIARHLL